MPRPDPWAERAGRWLAGRSTRRSFLGRLGQGAVLVASGEAIAGLLLADPAEARVCGQSGVAPRCPTYDCDDIWGWCWYATGCCADGGLKKICDCCRVDHPFVHGYCPSGTNVLCIVESCGADPRVQTRETARVHSDDPAPCAAGASSVRWARGSAPSVIVADADPLVAAVVAPWAVAMERPLLLATPNGIDARTAAELQRLGAKRATVVGWALGAAVDQALVRYGVSVTDRWGSASSAEALSVEVATFLRTTKGAKRQFCVAGGDVRLLAGVAGGAAASRGYPLLLGVDAAIAAATGPEPRAVVTYMVGEAASSANRVPGGFAVTGPGLEGVAARVARVLVAEGARPRGVAVAPATPAGATAAAGLAAVGGPVLLHAPGRLDGARDAVLAVRDSVRGGVAGGATGGLDDEGYLQFQSAVNAFEAHKLIGVAGQGLPVIPQPDAERPVGRARVASAAAPEAPGRGYWSGRTQPHRDG